VAPPPRLARASRKKKKIDETFENHI
jgi:hypothetical protein